MSSWIAADSQQLSVTTPAPDIQLLSALEGAQRDGVVHVQIPQLVAPAQMGSVVFFFFCGQPQRSLLALACERLEIMNKNNNLGALPLCSRALCAGAKWEALFRSCESTSHSRRAEEEPVSGSGGDRFSCQYFLWPSPTPPRNWPTCVKW